MFAVKPISDPDDFLRPFNIRLEPARAQGLDRKGRPSLDAWSSWSLSIFFTPASNTAFIKLRTCVQVRIGDTSQYLYIHLPPERIASLAVEVLDRSVNLRLILSRNGDLIGPVPFAAATPKTELDQQFLRSAQWLAARPALAIELLSRSRISPDRWQQFCRVCNQGLLKSDPKHTDLSPLYGGRGGHFMLEAYQEQAQDQNQDTESPPAYDDLAESSSSSSKIEPTRKRQRTSSTPCPDTNTQHPDPGGRYTMGKSLESYIQKICNDIVNRQRDEMIAPFLSRMEEMEDRITSRVIDHVESTLDRRLCEFREELDGDLEEEIDNRLEVVKEGMREYVVEETREQIAEEFATLEEEFVDKVMERIEER